MKKCSLIFTLGLSALLLISCNNETEENTDAKSETDTQNVTENQNEEETANVEEEKTAFQKFEDYAALLTKEELIEEFGEENLKDAIGYYAEGTYEAQTTTLTNPENEQVITFVWDEDGTLSWIEAYYGIYDEEYNRTKTQKIETNEGLFLGMSLKKLREWNGADFKFSGFDWDYGGGIFNTNEGKIPKSKISITLGYEGKLPDFAIGDVELNADDERLTDVNIIVESLTLHIE